MSDSEPQEVFPFRVFNNGMPVDADWRPKQDDSMPAPETDNEKSEKPRVAKD